MERVRECSDSILASADSCCGSPTAAITVQTTRKQVTKHALNSYLPEINKNIQNKTIRSACWIIGPVNKPDLFELKIEFFLTIIVIGLDQITFLFAIPPETKT
ncbi:MAG: hypothetical protein WBN03_13745 [Desulfobacterales bacterium]